MRSVDDYTRCGVNGATSPAERLRHETIDDLFRLAKRVADTAIRAPPSLSSPEGGPARVRARQVSDDITLIKADVDAAFRRCPLRPDHRRFAYVAFKHKGAAVIARHNSLPFGTGRQRRVAPRGDVPRAAIQSPACTAGRESAR